MQRKVIVYAKEVSPLVSFSIIGERREIYLIEINSEIK